jgi:hypothetical protein
MIPTSERQDIVTAYATAMKELEDRRESLAVKYHIGLIVWSGSTWSEGLQPYQDFRLLVKLRNSLLHMRPGSWGAQVCPELPAPERAIEEYPTFIRSLKHRKLIELPRKSQSWLEVVNTPAVGKWACSTSSNVTRLFVERAPDGYYKEKLEELILRYS